jgi:hypothetical protein
MVNHSRAACHQLSLNEDKGAVAHLKPGVAATVAK